MNIRALQKTDGIRQSALYSALKKAESSFQKNVPARKPVTECKLHWFSLRLIRQPDLQSRPAWWPTAPKPPYEREAFDSDLTDGKKSGLLDKRGAVRFDKIPGGTCQFHFEKFYDDIKQYFEEKLRP